MRRAHWSAQEELGGGRWQFGFLLFVFSRFGSNVLRLFALPLAFFFFLGARSKRRYSREFLGRAARFRDSASAKRCSSLRHFRAFAVSLADKMDAWAGRTKIDQLEIAPGDYDGLVADLQGGRGAVVLCSHLGNIEVFRALGQLYAAETFDFRIAAIVDFDGTGRFNEMIKAINARSMADIIPASNIGPDTVIWLRDFIQDGGMVVIAGDRTAAMTQRTLTLPFLGQEADFPYGSFLLADLLEAPVFSVFAIRTKETAFRGIYRVHVRKHPETGGIRRERDKRLLGMASLFRDQLQELAVQTPCQWFNFYPFWERAEKGRREH